MTIGEDMPPALAFQRVFSASGVQLVGRFFSRETPFCSGPRQLAQLPAKAAVGSRQQAAGRRAMAKRRSNDLGVVMFISLVPCPSSLAPLFSSRSAWLSSRIEEASRGIR